jgi:hypothetical protein
MVACDLGPFGIGVPWRRTKASPKAEASQLELVRHGVGVGLCVCMLASCIHNDFIPVGPC